MPFSAAADTHECETLEKLASNRTGAHDKVFESPKSLDQRLPEYGTLTIVPITA